MEINRHLKLNIPKLGPLQQSSHFQEWSLCASRFRNKNQKVIFDSSSSSAKPEAIFLTFSIATTKAQVVSNIGQVQ